MYQRILVPIDGSDGAMLALDKAIELAHLMHADMQAVFVVEHRAQTVDLTENFVEPMVPDDDTASRTATSVLDDARERFARAHIAGSTQAIDSYGDGVAVVLTRAIEDFSADLVVMYSHGRRGLKRLLAGSVSESLLRDTTVPLLLLRDRADVAVGNR
jgi:nucleotide-binding universal stress UspA family protein